MTLGWSTPPSSTLLPLGAIMIKSILALMLVVAIIVATVMLTESLWNKYLGGIGKKGSM